MSSRQKGFSQLEVAQGEFYTIFAETVFCGSNVIGPETVWEQQRMREQETASIRWTSLNLDMYNTDFSCSAKGSVGAVATLCLPLLDPVFNEGGRPTPATQCGTFSKSIINQRWSSRSVV